MIQELSFCLYADAPLVATLCHLTKLQRLDVMVKMEAVDLQVVLDVLSCLPHLAILSIEAELLDKSWSLDLAALKHLTSLVTLDFSDHNGSLRVQGGAAHLAQVVPQLTGLCMDITDWSSFASLSSLAALESLDLYAGGDSSLNVGPDDLVSALVHLPKLSKLKLWWLAKVTSLGLSAEIHRQLREVSVEGCLLLADFGPTAWGLPSLVSLEILCASDYPHVDMERLLSSLRHPSTGQGPASLEESDSQDYS